LEIIVVDDHSTDDSVTVAEALAKEDGRIRVVKNPKKGVASARNFGMKNARGAFIKFLDSDDFISDNLISAQVGVIKNRPGAIAHCGWAHFIREVGDLPSIHQATDRNFVDSGRFLAELWQNNMYPVHAWLVPRQLVSAELSWDEALTQNGDGEFLARIISKAQGVFFSQGTAFYRRPQTGNVSQQVGDMHMQSQLSALRSYRNVCTELNDEPDLLNGFHSQVCAIAYRASTTLEEMDCLSELLSMLETEQHDQAFPTRVMNALANVLGLKRAFFIRLFIARLGFGIGARKVKSSA
jgi:glycosyltransferase involved in cell wall biosynthesis